MSEKPCGAYFFAFFEKFVAPILTSGGYVGLSIATLLSQHHKVMAVDIVPEKVELINSKKSPIQDEYIILLHFIVAEQLPISRRRSAANTFMWSQIAKIQDFVRTVGMGNGIPIKIASREKPRK